MRFLDTNVLLYAISRAAAGSPAELGGSVQVMQEFYVQATRATRGGRIPHELAVEYVEHWQAFTVQGMTVEILRAALDTGHRFRISYWDAAVIEAARALGCRVVLSEDLPHGASYGGVRVENPFR